MTDSKTVAMALRRMGRGELTVHSFRSTFRDWAGATTAHPRELAEAALAHTLGNKVEAAYQRGDLLEKWRRLMEAWAAYCAKPVAVRAGAAQNMATARATWPAQ